MKSKTNLVSMVIGAALGTAAVLSLAATSTDYAAGGRFQLLAADNYLFKIDTATGQVWRTWINSPSRDFMQPNIGTPLDAQTNSAPPDIEKRPARK